MAWSKIDKAPLGKSERRATPDGIWLKCKHCQEVIHNRDLEINLNVCPHCDYHLPMSAARRLASFLDQGSFQEYDANLSSKDPLQFSDSKSYPARLQIASKKTGNRDAFTYGIGTLKGLPLCAGSYDFQFMGGSMGSVVGEKIKRQFLLGLKKQIPTIIFSASGGARMQEGILSLMQMAKTCTALSQLRDEGIPFFSVLTNPTTGGVAASYAMLGDINIGERGALIGFAGPRVIKQTIGQDLPPGFQTAEYLLEHGMLDLICSRHELRDTLYSLLRISTQHLQKKA